MDSQLAREGIELNWFDEVETLSSLIGYLGTGNFVGVVPRLMAAQMPAVAKIPLTRPKLQRQLFLVRRKDVELTPPAKDLWEDVRKTVLGSVSSTLPLLNDDTVQGGSEGCRERLPCGSPSVLHRANAPAPCRRSC